MDCRRLLAYTLLVTAWTTPIAAETIGGPAVTFQLRKPAEIIVPVLIDGRGPYAFILDTGSTHTVITETLAATLGAHAVAQAPVRTAAGTEMYRVVELPRVQVGPVEVAAIAATALPKAMATSALGRDVDGVLGQDVLAVSAFTIDYKTRRLTWNDDEGWGTRLALEASAGRYLVRVPSATCGCDMRFVPDSGADALVLFDIGKGPRLEAKSSEGSFAMTTVSGTRETPLVTIPRFEVGARVFRNQPAAVVRIDAADESRGDGLLPLHLFSRVHFDAGAGFVTVE